MVARHTRGDLTGLLASSAETELESPVCISASDRIHFLAQELVPHANRTRNYKALQILLQSASEKMFHIFHPPEAFHIHKQLHTLNNDYVFLHYSIAIGTRFFSLRINSVHDLHASGFKVPLRPIED